MLDSTAQFPGEHASAWQAALYNIKKQRKIRNPLDVMVDTTMDGTCGVEWTCGTGWTIGSGLASSDGTQVSVSSLTQATTLVVGVTYKVEYELTAVSAGSIKVVIGTGEGPPRTSAGTYYDYVVATGTNSFSFEADSEFAGSISYMNVYAIS